MLRRIFGTKLKMAHYNWTDHPRKWWWTLRIVIAFLLIILCVLMISRRGWYMCTDNTVYGVIALLTAARLPQKFKYRKIFSEAIKHVKSGGKSPYEQPDPEEMFGDQEQYSESEHAEYEQYQQHEDPVQSDFKFFASCVTKEDLDKTYKKLASIYHPDQNAGDAETFKKIQAEYAEAVLKYA